MCIRDRPISMCLHQFLCSQFMHKQCYCFIDPLHDPTLQATYTYTLKCIHVCGCVNFLHDLHSPSLDQSICHPSHLKKSTLLECHCQRDKDKRQRACSNSHAKKTQPLTLDNHACMHTHWCQKQNHVHTCECPYITHDDWFNRPKIKCIHEQHADLHCC